MSTTRLAILCRSDAIFLAACGNPRNGLVFPGVRSMGPQAFPSHVMDFVIIIYIYMYICSNFHLPRLECGLREKLQKAAQP